MKEKIAVNSKKEFLLPVIVIGLVAVLGFLGHSGDVKSSASSEFQYVKDKVSFDLYEPAYLPDGFSISKQSISESKKIQPDDFAFFATKENETIWFIESRLKREVDLKMYLSWKDLNIDIIDGKTVYFGLANGNMAASYIHNGTWVTIKPMQQMDKKELIEIIHHLMKVN
ncbi:TPA: hypothetical protein DDW69_03295 [candidate division CPR2 bacterium]|uniref:DUF4367 domain-containing protein n=1 Tax=candidate division CPR2 bacterium GW2011_GWC1_41_48 TaxID=1618344 RepID=A0A0G0W7X9_UNCC2|nr:MAG: hypothetical protein UT47_C0003G0146 [candidate division CPR2 bacterium GW2011_GWC2_39_35]KKR28369.1 MAG: hypothetical protein UT60_C0022G0025 [candidate division CPR2 bacterium GW2011_GWD2_39_7]KKR29131.1 MAG: hypothetical protein UT59_C0012G0008 [candidate division CPR2 bacterium GW2011_GWD1_39_7]KKS09085.1 MAG: hypothetical protein UU65_C0003G0140 [candidate division CPR2 bacterium GW2011_GWC1_41_48]OGB62146.1 MAG: hypothetical protein A2Y27_00605 [candidate division CPR2 bacterium G